MPTSFLSATNETPMSKPSAQRNLATSFQGIYYVTSGLWPILHMRSFEQVTGQKRDKWLVKTVGALITAIGSTLLFSAAREPESETARNLGISAALALIGIDSIYSIRGTIPKIYLMDAAVEAALVAGLLAGRPEPVTRRDSKTDRRK
jgi:hypothetical protein